MPKTDRPSGDRFIDRLRRAGVTAADSDEVRTQKTLLVFATTLLIAAAIVWQLVYGAMGASFPVWVPIAFQFLLAGNLFAYIRGGNFSFFRITQLALILFIPFVAQWSIGNSISASGIMLWGLLAPVGAILILGGRESLPWFLAYAILVFLTGFADYHLAGFGLFAVQATPVPERTSLVFFALNFLTVSALIYFLLRLSVSEKNRIESRLAGAHRKLQNEQARSERLLLSILPQRIATRLKRGEMTIADRIADSTIMFVDIVDFTRITEGMGPAEVFAMLDDIFSAFDSLSERYGLEKIKTIGDAYMVAGGLDGSGGKYTDAVASMALDIRDLLHRDFRVNNRFLEVHIGIASGPVVAGIIGRRKFLYDLWGDTVNLASRLTSEAPSGAIQVDEPTWQRLRYGYEFDIPQTVYLKGKGKTTTYRLCGRNV